MQRKGKIKLAAFCQRVGAFSCAGIYVRPASIAMLYAVVIFLEILSYHANHFQINPK